MRNVLVTGATSPLGQRLLVHLREQAWVGKLVGAEPAPTSAWTHGAELVAFEPDPRRLVALLRDLDIDTVIHTAFASDRCGDSTLPGDVDVIGTMQLCAALGSSSSPVRAMVVAASTSAYPVRSHAPLFKAESDAVESPETTTLVAAEDYVRDVAERAPHLCVAILRLAELAGRGVRGPLAALLSRPVVAAPIGFDPTVQFLHVDDAVRALAWAAELELPGVYNVASRGLLRWSRAVNLLGRRVVPVLPVGAGPLEGIARALRIPHIPTAMANLLRFGSAVATHKFEATGFDPSHDQESCLHALMARR